MANWNDPTVNSNYVDFVDEVKNRDVDSAKMFDGTSSTNLPELTIRWNQGNQRFERFESGTWQPRTIGVSGGGTGSGTASGARTALGIGTLGQQNSNLVSITGGNITGVTFSGTGNLSGNASTASAWQTSRDIKIGNTSKSVNGSANVTWTASEIGSTSATANTIATRTAAGNLYANAFYGNGANLTNINTTNIPNLVIKSYANEALNLGFGSSGDFTDGVVQCIRFNTDIPFVDIVIISTSKGISFSSSQEPASASLWIPPNFRPQATMFLTTQKTSSFVRTAIITTGGRVYFSHHNWSGSLTSVSSSNEATFQFVFAVVS